MGLAPMCRREAGNHEIRGDDVLSGVAPLHWLVVEKEINSITTYMNRRSVVVLLVIVFFIVVGVVLYRWQEAREKKEKEEQAERERKEKEEQAERERKEKEEQAERERIVPVSREQCLLTARALMNPLGLENDAVLHSVDRNDWPKGCVVDTNIGKVFWNQTKSTGGHGDGGQLVPCASGVGENRMARAGTECAIPVPRWKTHRVAKARCYETGRPIANNEHQERLVEIDDDNITSGCVINQFTGQVMWNQSTKTPWHGAFPRVCPPGGKIKQPYAGDAQCSDTPITIRTDNVPKEGCLQTAMLHVPPNIIPEATHLHVGSWPNVPKGCTLQTGGGWVAHWNNHPTGSNTPAHQPVCRNRRTDESWLANWDTKTCSEEQREVEKSLGERGKQQYHHLNPKSCAALAANAVPVPLRYSDEPMVRVTDATIPGGCIIHTGTGDQPKVNRTWYNHHPGKSRDDFVKVCHPATDDKEPKLVVQRGNLCNPDAKPIGRWPIHADLCKGVVQSILPDNRFEGQPLIHVTDHTIPGGCIVHSDGGNRPWFNEASGVPRADFRSVCDKQDGSGWFLSEPGEPCS